MQSWFGHGEPAAGVSGVLHATAYLQQQCELPIMHLRALNPHVTSALAAAPAASAALAGGAPEGGIRAPRQLAPKPMSRASATAAVGADGQSYEQRTVGVSAFAFQGTNAHVLLQAAPVATTAADVEVTSTRDGAMAWQKEQLWVVPPVSAFVGRAVASPQIPGGGSNGNGIPLGAMAAFETSPAHPALAAVAGSLLLRGRHVLPPSMLISVAATAVRVLATASAAADPDEAVVLADGVLGAPMTMSRDTLLAASLLVTVDCCSGAVAVGRLQPSKAKSKLLLEAVAAATVPARVTSDVDSTTTGIDSHTSSPAMAVLQSLARQALPSATATSSTATALNSTIGGNRLQYAHISKPAGDMEADVAGCCMAEAALQLQVMGGQGWLTGFDGWVCPPRWVGAREDGG